MLPELHQRSSFTWWRCCSSVNMIILADACCSKYT